MKRESIEVGLGFGEEKDPVEKQGRNRGERRRKRKGITSRENLKEDFK